MIQNQTHKRRRRSMWVSLLIFLLSFFALQYGWDRATGTSLERWVIDDATVRTSVALINWLTPQTAASAQGVGIQASGGGINIRNGCEGTEVLFLLMAALLAYPFTWPVRVMGLLSGTTYVFAINQLRLLVLFYSVRNDRDLFNQLHGVVAPLILIAFTLMFFVGLRCLDQRVRIDTHG